MRAWRSRAPWLLALWVGINFARALPFGFSDDDYVWIYGAARAVERPATIAVSPAFGGGFLRPVVQASYALTYPLAGTAPAAHRALNLAAHLAAVLLLWAVVRRLIGDGWIAPVVAAAFAVHPSCAQAVVWISGRTEVLCAVFYLAAVLLHLRGSILPAALCFALALGAKESALSLPLLLAGLELWRSPEQGAGGASAGQGGGQPSLPPPPAYATLLSLWPYAVVGVAYLGVRALLLDRFATDTFELARAGGMLAFVRHKITLVGEYLLAPLPVHGFWRSLTLLAAGALSAVWLARRSQAVAGAAIRLGLTWTVLTLLPYLPWFAFLPWYAYLPSMGTSLAFTGAGAALTARLPGPRPAAVLAAGLWLAASVWQLQAGIERERRAGARTDAVVAALAHVSRPARPGAVVVIDGLQADVLGGGAQTPGRPVLAYGLTEALRLRLGEDFLDVEHGDARHARLRAFGRPVVLLEWDEPAQAFRRAWQSF